MADVLFIKEDFFKEYSGINENMDFKKLKPKLIAVQDIYIQKILGTPLYEDLKTKITADPTLASNTNEKNLINNYIAKTLVWYAKCDLTTELKFSFQNKGVLVKSGDQSQNADTSDLKLIKSEYKAYADQYAELLRNYLQQNTATFPKYNEGTTTGMTPSQNTYTNGIFLRNYGEENQCQKGINCFDNCNCC
jgi:hypothetical protein